jgi:hypothetical protein
VLDIAGGTGDLARAFARKVGAQGLVVLTDINEAMLRTGPRPPARRRPGHVHRWSATPSTCPLPTAASTWSAWPSACAT